MDSLKVYLDFLYTKEKRRNKFNRKYRRKNNPSAEKGRRHYRPDFELGGPWPEKVIKRKHGSKLLILAFKEYKDD